MTTRNHKGRPPASPGLDAKISVELVEDAGDWSDFEDVTATVQQAADAVGAALECEIDRASVCVALSDDREVRSLNAQYRGKDKPTNVLSFPAGAGAVEGFLGDIILAYETIAREAHAQATPMRDHIQHLVVHGLLHLLGYDHEDEAEAERMEALEIAILAKLGIANPYTGELDPVKSSGAIG